MQEETGKGEKVLQATPGDDGGESGRGLKKKEEKKMASEAEGKDILDTKVVPAGTGAVDAPLVSKEKQRNEKNYSPKSGGDRRENWFFWKEKSGKLSSEEKQRLAREFERDRYRLMEVLDDIKAFIPPEDRITEAEIRIRDFMIRKPILNVLGKLKLITKFLENEQF